MAGIKSHVLFDTVNATGTTKDLEVPAGQTVLIHSIDFSGPSFAGIGSTVTVDPDGANEIIGASAGDKFIQMPQNGLQVVGSGTAGVDAKKVRIELKKVGAGAAVLLGCVVLYEEL